MKTLNSTSMQTMIHHRDGSKTNTTHASLTLVVLFIIFQMDPRFIAEIIPNYYPVRYGSIAAIMAIISLLHYKSLFAGLKSGYWILLLLIFSLYQILSSTWSSQPLEGVFMGCCFFLAVTAASAIGKNTSVGTIIHSFILSSLITTVSGAILANLLPIYGQEQMFLNRGDWTGFANQKNLYGYYSSLAGSICLVKLLSNRFESVIPISRRYSATAALILFTCALQSGSRGALAITAIFTVVSLWLVFPLKRSQLSALFSLSTISLLIYSAITFKVIDNDISVFGSNLDSSNRFTLWMYGLSSIEQDLIFGVGRSGFWNQYRADSFQSMYGWVLKNFHNTYVTIIVETGIVGIVIFISFTLATFAYLLRGLQSATNEGYIIATALFSSLIAYSFIESTIGRTTTLSSFFALTVVASALMPKSIPEA